MAIAADSGRSYALVMLFGFLRRWFGAAGEGLDPEAYRQALQRVPATLRLDAGQRARLQELCEAFLDQKRFVPAEGFELDPVARHAIAIQACIPILALGIRAYRGWSTIYVFPQAFRKRDAQTWRPGHNISPDAIAGLAVQGGGVALAWSEARRGIEDADDSYNPVIHEFAHKLDMLDGDADGRPPLPSGLTQRMWFDAFAAAFADFQQRVEVGERTRLSSYAATNPAEFFAVLSEVYFEDPDLLTNIYPEVWRMLHAFYAPPDN